MNPVEHPQCVQQPICSQGVQLAAPLAHHPSADPGLAQPHPMGTLPQHLSIGTARWFCFSQTSHNKLSKINFPCHPRERRKELRVGFGP